MRVDFTPSYLSSHKKLDFNEINQHFNELIIKKNLFHCVLIYFHLYFSSFKGKFLIFQLTIIFMKYHSNNNVI